MPLASLRHQLPKQTTQRVASCASCEPPAAYLNDGSEDFERRSVLRGMSGLATMPHFGDFIVGVDLLAILTNFKTQFAERAHIGIGDEDERKERDDVAAPVVQPQVVACEDQKRERDVMAEAVLTREQVKEFAFDDRLAALAAADAVVARSAEEFFARHGPCQARDWNGEDEEHRDLHAETHDVRAPIVRRLFARCGYGRPGAGGGGAGGVAGGGATYRVAANVTSISYECPSNSRLASRSEPTPPFGAPY